MKLLKRSDLDNIAKSKSDFTTQEVSVPEWAPQELDDETRAEYGVLIRSLSGAERGVYEDNAIAQRGKIGEGSIRLRTLKIQLCALSMIDPDTFERMYKDTEVNILAERSAIALERVFDAATELSGLSQQDVNKLANGLEKNQIA